MIIRSVENLGPNSHDITRWNKPNNLEPQRESMRSYTPYQYIRDLQWDEEMHPIIKWAFWLFLSIIVVIFIGAYTGAVPLSLQPVLLYTLTSVLCLLFVLMIIGWFKSFDRQGWSIFIVMLLLIIIIGFLWILST